LVTPGEGGRVGPQKNHLFTLLAEKIF